MIRPTFVAIITGALCGLFTIEAIAGEMAAGRYADDGCVSTVMTSGQRGTYLVRETRRLRPDPRIAYVDHRHRRADHRRHSHHEASSISFGLLFGYPVYRYNDWHNDNSQRRSNRSHWRHQRHHDNHRHVQSADRHSQRRHSHGRYGSGRHRDGRHEDRRHHH